MGWRYQFNEKGPQICLDPRSNFFVILFVATLAGVGEGCRIHMGFVRVQGQDRVGSGGSHVHGERENDACVRPNANFPLLELYSRVRLELYSLVSFGFHS